MIARGTILFDIVAFALAFWTARLVRRDRLYVGYAVIVLALLAVGVVLVTAPTTMMQFVAWCTGAQSPALAIGAAAALGAALLVIYMFSQLTIISNRLTTLVQELALDHADTESGSKAGAPPNDL